MSSSLEILNPEPWVPQESNNPNPQSAKILEELSTAMIQIFCEQDWSNPLLKYALPNFSAYIDYDEVRSRTLDEHIAFHKWMHKKYPGYVYEVETVSADVDDVKGLATVWATLRVTGHPWKIQRESVTILWWRRKQGQWRCYKQFGNPKMTEL
ncbi:hypothetical protein PRZ48_013483 [Zasmidium cellare]|uniref:DUF4440 domain-containing protein n=1 Tax=Zasmidium cellare TaxID=395010 RepID=A0ABR0E1P8_ZASCE|nr:hypothetical protein PRZ48_013483 [Zasmidium cellare]